VGKTMSETIPQITIFIGGINHSQMGGLWHCFTHIIYIMIIIIILLYIYATLCGSELCLQAFQSRVAIQAGPEASADSRKEHSKKQERELI
jgi:hypothetical protein